MESVFIVLLLLEVLSESKLGKPLKMIWDVF